MRIMNLTETNLVAGGHSKNMDAYAALGEALTLGGNCSKETKRENPHACPGLCDAVKEVYKYLEAGDISDTMIMQHVSPRGVAIAKKCLSSDKTTSE